MSRIDRPYIPQYGAIEQTRRPQAQLKRDPKSERWNAALQGNKAQKTIDDEREERKQQRERRVQLEEAIAALRPGDCFALVARDQKTRVLYIFVGRRGDRIRVAALSADGCKRIVKQECPPHINLHVHMLVSGYDCLELLVSE